MMKRYYVYAVGLILFSIQALAVNLVVTGPTANCQSRLLKPTQLSDVIYKKTFNQIPYPIKRDIIVSSIKEDGWVLQEQNINKPTYGNMLPTELVLPPADSQFLRRLEIRREIYSEQPDAVFVNSKALGFRDISQQLLDMTVDAYTGPNGPYEAIKSPAGQVIALKNKITENEILIQDSVEHPLVTAGLIGGTDFIIVKKNRRSGQLIVEGGFVASPYKYNLEDQAGLSLNEIHEGLVYKTKASDGKKAMTVDLSKMIPSMMKRMLANSSENMRTLTRPAWFITDNPILAQHTGEDGDLLYRENTDEYFPLSPQTLGRNTFLRVEREVMFGLKSRRQEQLYPEEGDDFLVFGLHPYFFTLEQVASQPKVAAKLYEGLSVDNGRSFDEEAAPMILRYLERRMSKEPQEKQVDTNTQSEPKDQY